MVLFIVCFIVWFFRLCFYVWVILIREVSVVSLKDVLGVRGEGMKIF